MEIEYGIIESRSAVSKEERGHMTKQPKSVNERKRESRKRKRRLGLTEFMVTIPNTIEAKEAIRKKADQLTKIHVKRPRSWYEAQLAARQGDIDAQDVIVLGEEMTLINALEESKRIIDQHARSVELVRKEDE